MIEINEIKCFLRTGRAHVRMDMSNPDNRLYRDLLVAVIISFERVRERSPKFVVFNNTIPGRLQVCVYRADITEDDLFDNETYLSEDYRLLCIRRDLDEQAQANAVDDEEPWVKFEVL